jgi:hypothetical protein
MTALFLLSPEVLFPVMKRLNRGLHIQLQQLTYSAIPRHPTVLAPI